MNSKSIVKAIIANMLGLLSLFMVFTGFNTFIGTSGTVQGSEFGMLITLVNQFGLFMVWVALYTLWRLIPNPSDKQNQ